MIQSKSTDCICRLDFDVKIEDTKKSFFVEANVPLVKSPDAMLAVQLLPSMKVGQDIYMDESVSLRLIKNVSVLQDIFKNWFPDNLKRIRVNAQTEKRKPIKTDVGIFFSSGVDSFYTFLKHQKEVTHLIVVQGIDTSLDQNVYFKKLVHSISKIADEYKKELIVIRTNMREFLDSYLPFEHSHGAFLSTLALCLQQEIGKVFIASSFTYDDMYPWGSHLLTDPLWGSESLEIVHDGCEATRFQKVNAIADSEIAMRHLRVCWENPLAGSYNCGKCEKCLRTMASLAVGGKLDRAKTFNCQFDLGRLRRTKLKLQSRVFFVDNLKALRKSPQGDIFLEEALSDALSGIYHKGIVGWPERAYKLLKRKMRNLSSVAPSINRARGEYGIN